MIYHSLQHFPPEIDYCLLDTADFLNMLDKIGSITSCHTSVAFGITSMYTNIPNDEGVTCRILAEDGPHALQFRNASLIQLF